MSLMTRSRHVAIAALLFAAASVPARAQAALPAAKDLIDKFAKAVGGEAWKSHKSARMKVTMEMPGAGLSATIEEMHVFPNVVFTKTTLAGMGDIKTGFDGANAWSIDPMQGPRLLSGAEADALREGSDPLSALRQSPDIVKSETTEKATMNGQECYKVKHTFKSGREIVDCFSVSDGLIIATTLKQTSAMGEMEVTQYQSDYKDFGGMKRPSTITASMMGQAVNQKVVSWEWDTVEASEIALPAEIKALVAKKP